MHATGKLAVAAWLTVWGVARSVSHTTLLLAAPCRSLYPSLQGNHTLILLHRPPRCSYYLLTRGVKLFYSRLRDLKADLATQQVQPGRAGRGQGRDRGRAGVEGLGQKEEAQVRSGWAHLNKDGASCASQVTTGRQVTLPGSLDLLSPTTFHPLPIPIHPYPNCLHSPTSSFPSHWC